MIWGTAMEVSKWIPTGVLRPWLPIDDQHQRIWDVHFGARNTSQDRRDVIDYYSIKAGCKVLCIYIICVLYIYMPKCVEANCLIGHYVR